MVITVVFLLPKEFKNAKYNVIYVAESTGLTLFRMVKTSRPIDANVGTISNKFSWSLDRGAGIPLAKLVYTLKHRAVVTDIEFLEDVLELFSIVGCYSMNL